MIWMERLKRIKDRERGREGGEGKRELKDCYELKRREKTI